MVTGLLNTSSFDAVLDSRMTEYHTGLQRPLNEPRRTDGRQFSYVILVLLS